MTSREKIIASAVEVFAAKGKHGARMEEIAEKARINKAMLYYFYSSKDNLYREVLVHIVAQIFERMYRGIKESRYDGENPVATIRGIVTRHFEAYSRNLNSTKIMVEAITNDPDDLRVAFKQMKLTLSGDRKTAVSQRFLKFFNEGIRRGIFRKMDPRQVLISIVGMNLIYFISKPIAQVMLDIDVMNETKFLKERQESIIDMVLYGIMAKGKV